MFFALTGLLLNHPEWFENAPPEQKQTLPLSASLKQAISQQENPTQLILNQVRQQALVTGRFQSSEVLEDEISLRLASPAGTTDIWIDKLGNQIEITRKPANVAGLINDLHRGKQTSTSWRWFIDIAAIIIMLLSIAGYILFFMQAQRLISHLLMTLFSIVLFGWLIWQAV